MRRPGSFLFLLFIVSLTLGCTFANRSKWKSEKIAAEQKTERPILTEGRGDAYLFDLKIYNNGRKNSVRLDIYRKENSLALFARGYLGKGVLKGLVNKDSIITFFPTENQFYSGELNRLLSGNCFENIPFEKMLVDFFRITPDKIDYSFGEAYLSILEEKPGFRKYRLVAQNCSEYIELDYDWKKGQFMLERLKYSREDGKFRLDAKRRKFKLNIKLPAEKFQISIPSTASRIYP